MKWGRKNSHSSSKANEANGGGGGGGGGGGVSSWISKIKQISGNSSKSPTPPAKTKQKIKVNSSPPPPPLYHPDQENHPDQEKEEAAYWRLSFGKESFEGKKSTVLGSVWFDSSDGGGGGGGGGGGKKDDDDRLQIRVSNHRPTTQSFTDMVSDVRKTKENVGVETPRRKIQKGRKVISSSIGGKSRRRNYFEDFVYSDSGRDSIEVNLEPIKTMNSRKSHYISSSNLNKSNNREEIDDDLLVLDRKIVINKTEKQRKSVDLKKSRVRIYSPRTPSKVEIIKIRAIEEMKKSKLKKKKKKKEEMEMEGRRRRGLESCAMVKCSYDPQNDFRESMVEMILEKKIRRSDELEELLACYLTLNSDEYHDLIIKVFKQVWFDLNRRSSFSPELVNQDHSYSDYY